MVAEAGLRPEPLSQPRKKVLFLAKVFPWPLNFGARQRVFHLARGIAAAHETSAVAYDAQPSAEDEAEFLAKSGCTRVLVVPRKNASNDAGPDRSLLPRFAAKLASLDARLRSPLPPFVRDAWSDRLVAALDEIRRADAVDVVYATQSWMAEHARAAGFRRIVVDVDDLVSEMSRQRARASGWNRRKAIQLFDAAKSLRYERSLPRRFTRVVVAKSQDRDFFPAVDRSRVFIVPNGVTLPPAASPQPAIPKTLLFVGTLGYGPNIDAIRWFATEILPLIWERNADVRFTVAGYGSAESVAEVLQDARCAVHESPLDLAPLYDAAAVVVTPVRTGGGTRIKILEALGRGRAVVSTLFAAEGLGLRGGVEIEFADAPADIATLCLDLLRDEERRTALATAGRATVAKRFDWCAIERGLPGLVSSLVSRDMQRDESDR
jgi:glycosyltransferase involved in cell wall biosynthesis